MTDEWNLSSSITRHFTNDEEPIDAVWKISLLVENNLPFQRVVQNTAVACFLAKSSSEAR